MSWKGAAKRWEVRHVANLELVGHILYVLTYK